MVQSYDEHKDSACVIPSFKKQVKTPESAVIILIIKALNKFKNYQQVKIISLKKYKSFIISYLKNMLRKNNLNTGDFTGEKGEREGKEHKLPAGMQGVKTY